jgi:hypothetical protein
MADEDQLEAVFGEEFSSKIQQRTAERRQERNRVTDEQLMAICARAIHGDEFDPDEGDPMFTYTTDNGLSHNVLLMQVPDPQGREIWENLSEPWEGAARLPLEYLGEWYWSTFPQKQDVAKLSQGDWVIVVGNIEEQEGDEGEIYKNIYPVRGIATLDEAQEYAQQAEQTEFSEDSDEAEEEPEEEDEEEDEVEEDAESTKPDMFADDEEGEDDDTSSSESSSESSGASGMAALVDQEGEQEDSEPVPYDKIAAKLEEMAEVQDDDEEPQLWEIEEGTKNHQRITQVVINQLDDLDDSDLQATAEVVIDVVEGHRSNNDEEEEEDDDAKLFDI